MPGINGFRLCQRLRAHPGLQLTPVIFVTRRGDVEQRVRGLQVGGNDYLAKPFEPDELVARVQSHLVRLAELRELALRDGLTRCYNNRYFKRRLEQELSRAGRHQNTFSVAMIDIDHFKRINDAYGHPAGDAVLVRLASTLVAAVRSHDVVTRYGGEEFGVILIEAAGADAELVSNRLRERVQLQRFELPALAGERPLTVNCTLSIGIASYRKGDTSASLVQRADTALYEAKNAGRNRVWLSP
jgi:diguanylate cyclase (GGDEF)-like protein